MKLTLDKNKVEVNVHTGSVSAVWTFSEDTPALFKDIFIKRIKQSIRLKRRASADIYADGNGLIITYPSMDKMKENISLTSQVIKGKLFMCHQMYMEVLAYKDNLNEIKHKYDILTEDEKNIMAEKTNLLEEKGDWPE